MHVQRNVLLGIAATLVPTYPALACDDLAAPPSLEDRLARLCERLEEQREKMRVPGFSIAVVKDDEVILTRGFGLRDIENQVPADADTIFAIGSSTKAFTATLIGMLIDEGKMSWDDHPSKHLPGFRIFDDEANAKLTIGDALSHRSGVGRTDLLWASGSADRELILKTFADAEPMAGYGEEFHYNNIMFLAAGEASARAAGTDWDSLVRERLLQPLGMKRSNSRISEAQQDPTLSVGYDWDEDREEFIVKPMRSIDNVAPAGAINSSAREMAQWVRFQLAQGEIDGARLVSRDRIEETWTPRTEVGPTIKYGLGWFIQEWRGRRVIEHGGNIDGFGAMVALLPEENIGYVLLTNVSHTPLQQGSMELVFDALLGEWSEGESHESIDFTPYLGEYRFEPMDTFFTVLIKEGELAVDIPGQMVFALKQPDAEGKWRFAVTDQIAVSFDRSDDDEVISMRLHQSGLEFELPRKGVERPVEVDLEAVHPLLGTYEWIDGSAEMRVLVQNGRLAVDVPGQMVYELHAPDDEGRWAFRMTDTINVKFDVGDDGAIGSMTMTQNGVETQHSRVGDSSEAPAPPLEEIEALMRNAHRVDRLGAINTLRASGSIHMVNQGLRGGMDAVCAEGDRFRYSLDLGAFGDIHTGFDGERAWSVSAFSPYEELLGDRRDAVRLQHPLVMFLPWEGYDEARVHPDSELDGRRVHRVELKRGKVTRRLSIDADTGMLLREVTRIPMPGVGQLTQTTLYNDCRDVAGALIPFRIESSNDLLGRTVVQIEQVEVNPELGREALQPPHERPDE